MNNAVDILKDAIKEAEADYAAAKESADWFNNNTLNVGISVDYQSYPPMPSWVEPAKELIKSLTNSSAEALEWFNNLVQEYLGKMAESRCHPNEKDKFTAYVPYNQAIINLAEFASGVICRALMGEGMAQVLKILTEIRNRLYDSLPTGEMDANSSWELLQSIKRHLNDLDNLCNSVSSPLIKENVDENIDSGEKYTLAFCEKCVQMTNHVCQKCKPSGRTNISTGLICASPGSGLKRYLVFYGHGFYPNGGMSDFLSDHDTPEDAWASVQEKIAKELAESGYDSIEELTKYRWWNVYDTVSKCEVSAPTGTEN